MIDVVKELITAARLVADEGSPGLNGMSNREARKFMWALLHRYTKGFFRDNAWNPVTKTFRELADHGVDYVISKTEYYKDDRGELAGKIWRFTVEFINNKGRKTTLYGTITASGAGSVEDPLDRYDVTAVIG